MAFELLLLIFLLLILKFTKNQILNSYERHTTFWDGKWLS